MIARPGSTFRLGNGPWQKSRNAVRFPASAVLARRPNTIVVQTEHPNGVTPVPVVVEFQTAHVATK